MNRLYILNDDHTTSEAPDFRKWAAAVGKSNRVAHDIVHVSGEEIRVSTVFLGLDHNFFDSGPPILFETMCFKGHNASEFDQRRYATWDEAVAGHNEILNALRAPNGDALTALREAQTALKETR